MQYMSMGQVISKPFNGTVGQNFSGTYTIANDTIQDMQLLLEPV